MIGAKMGFGIKTRLLHYLQNKRWKQLNKDNYTYLTKLCDISNITVGRGTYGPIHVEQTGTEGKLRIGSWCSIAPDVTFVLNNEHPLNTLSTYPFKAKALGMSCVEAQTKGGIIVEDDVWIGYRATILDGVRVCQGSVVASGAVVTKDVPPYSIVGGVPAKVIGMRFDRETVDKLCAVNLDNLDKQFIELNLDLLYKPLSLSQIHHSH